MANIVVTKKSVNNKSIFEEIDTFIHEILESGLELHDEDDRWIFTQETENVLDMFVGTGKIINYDVMFDYRNNKRADMVKGKYNIIVKYKQFNCLNTTQLIYDIDNYTTKR